MIINNRFEEPFDKFPKEDEQLPLLSRFNVKSRLTEKFYKTISCDKNIEDVEIEKFKDRYTISPSNSKNRMIENKMLLKKSNYLLWNHNLIELLSPIHSHEIEKLDKFNSFHSPSSRVTGIKNRKIIENQSDLLKISSCSSINSRKINSEKYGNSGKYAWDIEKLKRLVESLQEQINVFILNFKLFIINYASKEMK